MREAAKNRREELGPQLTQFRLRKSLQIAKLTIVLTTCEFDLGKLGGETDKRRAKDTKRRKDKCKKSVTKRRISSLMFVIFFTLTAMPKGPLNRGKKYFMLACRVGLVGLVYSSSS